jgi:hypothetical protein
MAAKTDYQNFVGSAIHGEAVTKSDTVDLSFVSRAVYVGGAGDLAVIMRNGETITLVAVPAGTLLPIAVSRVMSTNTTATSIVALA